MRIERIIQIIGKFRAYGQDEVLVMDTYKKVAETK